MRGTYLHEHRGRIVARETFARTMGPDGHVTTTGERHAPDHAVCLGVAARATADGAVGEAVFNWREAPDGPTIAAARWLWDADRVLCSRDGEPDTAVSPAPPFVVFPLLRAFTGPAVLRLLELGGEGTWITPDIADPSNRERLFTPHLSTRRAWRDAAEPRFAWLEGGPYATPARLALDEAGALLSYAFTPAGLGVDDTWLVRLEAATDVSP